MILISEATTGDIEHIRSIAHRTWPVVYADIISQEQIAYMLDLFYSPQQLEANISLQGHHFLLLQEDEQTVGFAAFQHNVPQQYTTRLHKLYLLPETHGKGLGKRLLHAVAEHAANNGCNRISLNVNKYNPAKKFYESQGFTVVGEEKIPIGMDFFMDDFIMEKEL